VQSLWHRRQDGKRLSSEYPSRTNNRVSGGHKACARPPKVAEQADTELVSVATIMLSPSFRRGVEEYRARKKPNFEDTDWAYDEDGNSPRLPA